jgi:hypothetical protein
MKEIREVFGALDDLSVRAAAILDQTIIEKQDEVFKVNTLESWSMADVESSMNTAARALIALGVVTGDLIVVDGLDYSDSLVLHLAAEQIGVNVDRVSTTKGKGAKVCFGKADRNMMTTEFNVRTPGGDGEGIDWEEFMALSRFVSEWELNRCRVIAV